MQSPSSRGRDTSESENEREKIRAKEEALEAVVIRRDEAMKTEEDRESQRREKRERADERAEQNKEREDR